MTQWWVTSLWEANPVLLASWAFWVIFSICLHELGHGVAAIRCGDDTPRATGHMTWNPLVHMGPWSLLMFAIVGIAWGLMPVNPDNFRRRYDEAIVAFAGPLVNLLLAIACIVLASIWLGVFYQKVGDPFYSNFATFLRAGAGLNIVLLLFNLAPVPPLDGSRIAATFFRPYREFMTSEKGAIIALVLFVLLFMGGGSRIFGFAFGLAVDLIIAGARLFR